MKLLVVLPVLVIGTLASKVELNNPEIMALLGRAIDPKTMDPTQLSVLSVLRTAMPTGPDTPLPTGDYEPEWYQKLPAEVKSLLPSLYPAATIATATDSSTTMHEVVSSTPVPSATSSLAAPSLLLPISAALVSSALVNNGSVSDNSPATCAPAPISTSTPSLLWTPRITTTKTVQHAFTATAGTNSTVPWPTGLANGTLSIAAPLPSEFFSTGAKTTIKMETLAAVMWVGVSMGFFIFA
ncbi:Nn.00g055660.m01.CDS01 [Neocucurbitaria sp. VM-36]